MLQSTQHLALSEDDASLQMFREERHHLWRTNLHEAGRAAHVGFHDGI